MKLRAHVASALAVAYAVDQYLAGLSQAYASSVVARASLYAVYALLQYVVDGVGHTWVRRGKRVYPRRNRLHSLPAMLAMAAAAGAPLYPALGPLALAVYAPAMLVHWAEDAVTEGGVYLWRRRVRLPFRVRYDDPLANRAAIAAAYAFSAAYVDPFNGDPYALPAFAAVTAYAAVAFLTV